MGIGKGGSQTTTTNVQNQNVAYTPTGLPQFQQIYNTALNASQIPYQGYGGELVTRNNLEQGLGGQQIANYSGQAQPFLNYAANQTSGVGPLTTNQIQNYMNPYQSNVIDALKQNINETNAQQLQQVRGNAAAQHALGGDREAVAESELARQQNLGNAPAIANALAGGYNQALQTAGQQYQQLPLQQAQQYGNIGLQSQQAGLQSGEAMLNAGTIAQQTNQAQDTAQYQQYLQQLAYPYQQAQFLANIGIPAAGGMGGLQSQIGFGNQVTTPPGLSWGQGLAGLGLIGAGLFLKDGGRVPHKDSGGSIDSNNPFATEPWNVKAVDITKGNVGTPLQTPQSQIKPLPNITFSQGAQQSNPLGDIKTDITAGKGLAAIGNKLGGLFGDSTVDALASDPGIALGGLGNSAGLADAAATAGDSAVLDAIPFFGMAKKGGRIYPERFADGGSPYDAAVADISGREQQGGQLMQSMLSRARDLNPYINTAMTQRAAPPPQGFAGGGDADDDDQPWALESRWPTRGTDTAIPPWKSADPRGDTQALRNYGLTRAPEVSPNTSSITPLPQPRPALPTGPVAKPDDDEDEELPSKSTPDSGGATRSMAAQPSGAAAGFDPSKASYADIMNRNNFKDYAPQRQSLKGLLMDPKTRGDALMEMGLRILAAPPTSKSGLQEIASGMLGTVADYNKFSSDKLSAQEKAQELAAKLKQQSGNDEYNEARLELEKDKLKALTDYRNQQVDARFHKVLHGNIVPVNYQMPGPTGAVIAAYFDKTNGQYYDATTHQPLSGGRYANSAAVDLGLGQRGGAPAKPDSVPEGSQFSPSRRQWRDASGKIYDENGQLVQ